MDCFAAAKQQFRLHLRPDEVLEDGDWSTLTSAAAPRLEEIHAALAQLAEWGNLESQPDTARVASISDFYRARFVYRLSLAAKRWRRRSPPSAAPCADAPNCRASRSRTSPTA